MVQDAALQKISIALIEDDEDDYVIIQDYLHEFRWAEASLEWADNYDDGLALMSENRHAVYLLDYRLGNETGLDLLRAALRAINDFRASLRADLTGSLL